MEYFTVIKMIVIMGAWLTQLVEHATLNLWVMNSRLTLGKKLTLKKKKKGR